MGLTWTAHHSVKDIWQSLGIWSLQDVRKWRKSDADGKDEENAKDAADRDAVPRLAGDLKCWVPSEWLTTG